MGAGGGYKKGTKKIKLPKFFLFCFRLFKSCQKLKKQNVVKALGIGCMGVGVGTNSTSFQTFKTTKQNENPICATRWVLKGNFNLKSKKLWLICQVFHAISMLPGGSMIKNPLADARRHRRCGFHPWVGKTTHSVLLPRESYGQRTLAGYSPRGGKESDMTGHACVHI